MLQRSSDNVPAMKAGEVAAELHTTTRTLRYYEEEQLITVPRSAKGIRLYGRGDVERLRTILLLAELGVPLEQIKRFTSARSASATGNEASRTVAAELSELRREAEDRIAKYRRLIKDLDLTEKFVEQCFGCRKKPTLETCDRCPIGSKRPQTDALTIIWDRRHDPVESE